MSKHISVAKASALLDSLETVATELNEILVGIVGPEAEWSPGPPYAGISELSATTQYIVSKESLVRIAELREEANSVLHWISENPND